MNETQLLRRKLFHKTRLNKIFVYSEKNDRIK